MTCRLKIGAHYDLPHLIRFAHIPQDSFSLSPGRDPGPNNFASLHHLHIWCSIYRTPTRELQPWHLLLRAPTSTWFSLKWMRGAAGKLFYAHFAPAALILLHWAPPFDIFFPSPALTRACTKSNICFCLSGTRKKRMNFSRHPHENKRPPEGLWV